ncbi:MAG: hypothetical protein R3F34_00975 [Planctomycetota bacterium]
MLALGEHAFTTQQILLGAIPDHEVGAVLERRASVLAKLELGEVVWFAQRLAPPLAASRDGAQDKESNWILHARPRRTHLDLLARLRADGVRVVRTIAVADALPRILGSTAEGRVLVAHDDGRLRTYLVRDGELVQTSRLELRHDDASALHLSVVQEVRQVAAFWAKGSRGAPLVEIRLVGLSSEETESLATPLSIAAQGAEVTDGGSSPTNSDYDSGAANTKAIAAVANTARDLSLPLPVSRPRAAVVTVVATGLAALVGLASANHFDGALAERGAEIRSLTANTRDLEASEGRRAAFERARSEFGTALTSLATLADRGVPFERVLTDVMALCGPSTHFEHIAFAKADDGVSVALEGSIDAGLAAATATLDALRTRLARDPAFRTVEVQPSTRVPEPGEPDGLAFTVVATYAGGAR